MAGRTRVIARWLRRQAPKTLFGRSLLIIVLPVALMQIAVTYVFFDAHWQTVTARLSEGLAGDIAWAVESYKEDPTPQSFARLSERAEDSMSLSIALQPGRSIPERRRDPPVLFEPFFAPIDRSLTRALDARLDDPYWFDTTRYPAYVDIRVQVPQGVLRILAPRERAFATQGHIFVLWMTVATVLLTAIAILFIRNQTRAIERLANAAEGFGRGTDVDFKPQGAREVRRAGHAFIDMRGRIARHIEQRTAILASVSHDLRTPLTRLKLALALSDPNPRTVEMKRDLAEMEHMIDEYLAFARGEGGSGVAEPVSLRPMLEEVGEGARRAGAQVRISADPDLAAIVRPSALKRALSNLVMNAAAHGDQVELAARASPSGGLEIVVDDNGPGIPEERYQDAFKPFVRLDEARNQNTKGVGLGLAIARDVARRHGGEITLERSPLGGLRAVVRLPG